MKRVSPYTLIELLEATQKSVLNYYYSLDLWAPSRFAVSWAGEDESQNWFHIAREYTERWHHQQQIREAVGKEDIMEKEFFYPVIQTFMMALPHAYRNTMAAGDSVISVRVNDASLEEWRIIAHNQKWNFTSQTNSAPDTQIEMSADTAWKLFTKALPETVESEKIKILGNQDLGKPILKMVSVIA